MRPPLLQATVSLVRVWTRLYSWQLPESIRNARRAEIESDLWECQQAATPTAWLPLQIVARLILGLPDDLGWRFEHDRTRLQPTRTAFALIAGVVMIVTVVWIGLAAQHAELPPAPAAPPLQLRRAAMPPPPPPPPPPCNPPGIGRPAFSPCTPL
jgi:hypothetical protein